MHQRVCRESPVKLRSTISSRPQRVFNALGYLIANEGSDEGKRLQL